MFTVTSMREGLGILDAYVDFAEYLILVVLSSTSSVLFLYFGTSMRMRSGS